MSDRMPFLSFLFFFFGLVYANGRHFFFVRMFFTGTVVDIEAASRANRLVVK